MIGNELRKRGNYVKVVSQEYFEKNFEALKSYSIIVFHRPAFSDILGEFLISERSERLLIADFDDLIFDVSAAEDTPAIRSRNEPMHNVQRDFARNFEITNLFRYISVSTEPLRRRAGELFPNAKQISVVHNALDETYRDIARICLASRLADNHFHAAYFSGTASHDRDLAVIAPHLVEAFRKSDDFRMLLMGPVKIPDLLKSFVNRITVSSIIPYYELPRAKKNVDLILAPLEANRFTACKSGLKFFEAAAVGCRVAAYPIEDIARFSSPLLAPCVSPDDWEEALAQCGNNNQEQRVANASLVAESSRIEVQCDRWMEAFYGAR